MVPIVGGGRGIKKKLKQKPRNLTSLKVVKNHSDVGVVGDVPAVYTVGKIYGTGEFVA